MKRNILFLLIFFFLSSLLISEVNLEEHLQKDNISTYIKEGIRFVPLDDLAATLGAQLSFGISEGRAYLFYQNHQISLIAGCNDILVDGKKRRIEPPPQFLEGEGIFVVPLAPMKEILDGLEVLVPSEAEKEKISPSIEGALTPSSNSGSKKIIVLDPGHGGRDPGAIGEYGLREKDVNLDIALRLNNLLGKRKELVVLMTRKEDKELGSNSKEDLAQRIKFANEKKASLFLSIHTNSARYNRWDADGFETYCPRSKEIDENNNLKNEADLGVIIRELNEGYVLKESERLASFIQEELSKRLIIPNRGVKRKNYYVLKYTQMPSVLVEIGFICNPNVEVNLRDPHVREVIAETIYKAIIRYFQE